MNSTCRCTCRSYITRSSLERKRVAVLHLSSYRLIPWKEKCDRVTCTRQPLRSIHATTAAVPSINTGFVFAILLFRPARLGPVQGRIFEHLLSNEISGTTRIEGVARLGYGRTEKSMVVIDFQFRVIFGRVTGNQLKSYPNLIKSYRILVHAYTCQSCFHMLKLITFAKYIYV